jgi:Uma2 family endonuclease
MVAIDVLAAPWAEPAPSYRRRTLTATDLTALPADKWLYELVAGLLVRMPPPQEYHGYLAAEISGTLRDYVKKSHLGRVYVGDTGFNLTLPDEDKDTILGTDVAFVRAERLPSASPASDAYFPGPPDLAVEIASPSQFRPEMGAKAWLWLQRGTRLVWVVWPARREVDVWTPGQDTPVTVQEGASLEGGDVLPGFSYPLADLFA